MISEDVASKLANKVNIDSMAGESYIKNIDYINDMINKENENHAA